MAQRLHKKSLHKLPISSKMSTHPTLENVRHQIMYTSEGKKIVYTDKAPKTLGPYSQAIRTENLVFAAGQLGVDPSCSFVSHFLLITSIVRSSAGGISCTKFRSDLSTTSNKSEAESH